MVGLLGAPAAPSAVRGDELSDARARQAQLKKDVADQKAQIAQLAALQGQLADAIRNTTIQLKGINADLTAVKTKINTMQTQINVIKADYADLVAEVQGLDATLAVVTAQEDVKRGELADRKALLAERVRNAYDTDRTSLLESFLSGGTFTDLLSEMSDYIDIGEQDKALAEQISLDQETLASLHQTTAGHSRPDRRPAPADGRPEARPRQEPGRPQRGQGLAQAAREARRVSAGRPEEELRGRRREQGQRAQGAGQGRRRAEEAAEPDRLADRQADAARQHPVRIQRDPPVADGWRRHAALRVYRVLLGARRTASCSHFHQGIDIVAPYGTPVHASGDGQVVYIGWNYADGPDPAWIVIIAHSQGLQTWYAHMSPKYPGGIHAGSTVHAGQVIGYEASTGHSTGAHLHWAVMLNGTFVNPRLFL